MSGDHGPGPPGNEERMADLEYYKTRGGSEVNYLLTELPDREWERPIGTGFPSARGTDEVAHRHITERTISLASGIRFTYTVFKPKSISRRDSVLPKRKEHKECGETRQYITGANIWRWKDGERKHSFANFAGQFQDEEICRYIRYITYDWDGEEREATLGKSMIWMHEVPAHVTETGKEVKETLSFFVLADPNYDKLPTAGPNELGKATVFAPERRGNFKATVLRYAI